MTRFVKGSVIMSDMDETDETMRELAKTLAAIYDRLGYETPLSYSFNRNDIPTLRASERIRVVIIREHDNARPMPLVNYAGYLEFATG